MSYLLDCILVIMNIILCGVLILLSSNNYCFLSFSKQIWSWFRYVFLGKLFSNMFCMWVIEGSVTVMGRKFEDSLLWLFPNYDSTTILVVPSLLASQVSPDQKNYGLFHMCILLPLCMSFRLLKAPVCENCNLSIIPHIPSSKKACPSNYSLIF